MSEKTVIGIDPSDESTIEATLTFIVSWESGSEQAIKIIKAFNAALITSSKKQFELLGREAVLLYLKPKPLSIQPKNRTWRVREIDTSSTTVGKEKENENSLH